MIEHNFITNLQVTNWQNLEGESDVQMITLDIWIQRRKIWKVIKNITNTETRVTVGKERQK